MPGAADHLHFDLTTLPQAARYKLVTGIVVPRPIAWVSTLDAAGHVNLAPYSFFNVMGSDPPVVAFAPGDRSDGTPKDTARNIPPGGEFTVNLVSRELAEAMNATATDFPAHLGEPQQLGIPLEPGVSVRTPRVQGSPAALECREVQTVVIGATRIILGEVIGVSVRADAVLDAGKHYLDTAALDLIGRMGGRGGYATTRDAFTIDRVTYEQWQARTAAPDAE
ncbi:flavin reductase (DIM6/NTAB) family NADH-FMN oxidoreductase RutF [Deinococcus metalli]|uniref:Flavin reductase (DIM6/NTAB) family NADH-FMN oxidoreductase RutF n=1 Tax=Deinococcus metalli TaxID=1141878 RepID=A0A7W8KGK0_9DEIO|nr:flavin reductase family protein [Deinococcus metalli]MBB5376139.1 flavin reductase (DIM6/NTAB) family NADH-FMN oxidoreductase RutF [Deinococcus metalli]GHF40501.1 hypothetical protein GCM10017781_16420 [Deinococcus metalli]